jgi:uncharacterized protein (TIGR00159 family)
MLNTIVSFIDEFRGTFRVVDAVDIALVSVFLYATLVWFHKAASRGVLIGVAALAAVYFLARGLDMYLTSLAFHTSFAVLLFVLVVVFQEDLRRLLEGVSSLRSMRFGKSPQRGIDVDELVASVFRMAASRTGALVVLKGKESLARHVNDGVSLDGRFSPPLLYSIFDPNSVGHDGAVIVEGERVSQFGAHLPISKNTQEIKGRGMRHTAALGLSERSDALTIVVSEERGTVSVAATGHLREIKTAAELKRRTEAFFEESFPAAQRSSLRHGLLQHGRLKVLSVVLAVTAWFVLAYDPHTVQRTFVVPIEYRNLSQDLVLDSTARTEARVTLSGSERDFRFLDPATLKISLDLSDLSKGYQEVAFSERAIKLPANLSVYRIEPRSFSLWLMLKEPALIEPTHQGPPAKQTSGANPVRSPANQSLAVAGADAPRPAILLDCLLLDLEPTQP